MTTTESRTALVTGASSGIGEKLAAEFAADGYDVALTARRRDRLEAHADRLEAEYGVETHVVTADLAEPDAPAELLAELRDRDVQVDALVNNAGFSTYGPFAGSDRATAQDMIQVNLASLTDLTHRVLDGMVERGHGEILNTASMAGMAPTPNTAVYAATKSYVLSFSEALAHELEDDGVTVTALCPGPVDTELIAKEGMADSDIDNSDLNDPESVARAGYQGLKDGDRVVVPSRRMQALAQLKRVLPRKRVVSLAANQYEQYG
ncbi:SDR family NAD(P)-dependent oxidoreductase [Haloarchaeobius amylolyticus]|uniref:SDR family NAD(P)-dependent oxidoreductase n=1 Tax=Haloarchaeobius amylolyticus TaxID=1198296 RepID=UPI00226F6ED3|nr:SDR family oxidoreductase [Haloarchaeobius amylolyticus]